MSNIFSSRFWKALYFRAVGGQATDAETPSGDISARLAGSGSLYGRMSLVGEVAATMSASGSLVATLSITEAPPEQALDLLDTHDGVARQPVYDEATLRAASKAEEEAEQAKRSKERKSKRDLQRIIARALGEPDPEATKPGKPPAEIVPVLEAQPASLALVETDALALKQKEEDNALIILLLAA